MAQLDSSALLSPNGPVEPFLFPEEDSIKLAARLKGYLDNAYALDTVAAQLDESFQNNLARAYALYQVYLAVYTRLSANPSSLTVTEKGAHAYTAEQIRNFKALSDKYLADFNSLLVVPPATQPARFPGTVSAKTVYEW